MSFTEIPLNYADCLEANRQHNNGIIVVENVNDLDLVGGLARYNIALKLKQ